MPRLRTSSLPPTALQNPTYPTGGESPVPMPSPPPTPTPVPSPVPGPSHLNDFPERHDDPDQAEELERQQDA